jgi:hypothetical protein
MTKMTGADCTKQDKIKSGCKDDRSGVTGDRNCLRKRQEQGVRRTGQSDRRTRTACKEDMSKVSGGQDQCDRNCV